MTTDSAALTASPDRPRITATKAAALVDRLKDHSAGRMTKVYAEARDRFTVGGSETFRAALELRGETEAVAVVSVVDKAYGRVAAQREAVRTLDTELRTLTADATQKAQTLLAARAAIHECLNGNNTEFLKLKSFVNTLHMPSIDSLSQPARASLVRQVPSGCFTYLELFKIVVGELDAALLAYQGALSKDLKRADTACNKIGAHCKRKPSSDSPARGQVGAKLSAYAYVDRYDVIAEQLSEVRRVQEHSEAAANKFIGRYDDLAIITNYALQLVESGKRDTPPQPARIPAPTKEPFLEWVLPILETVLMAIL
jgi:hypothetical protein